MAIQKKSLISSRTSEKKSATKKEASVGEVKSLTAKALNKTTLRGKQTFLKGPTLYKTI
jgi:hypothetical protein